MWNEIEQFFNRLPSFAWNLLLAAGALCTGLIFKWVLSLLLTYYSRKNTGFSFFRTILYRLGKPVNFFLPLLILNIVLPLMRLKPRVYFVIDKITGILLIISFAAVLMGIVKVAEDYVIYAYDLKKENNLKERKIRTQLQFIRKLVIFLIVILAICGILMSFENMRRIGAGLLTGVGVSGLIVGFAAQRSLSNLLAGLQIAFTQPIRIDDVLLVEGEWGRVEEITLTYVVLSIWDERRLILPINYFIEKPFQNWTRTTSNILGTVYIYLDYNVPVQQIRQEFTRLLQTTDLWDRRVQVLQVTDITEHAIQLRALMSASSSGKAFDLRCYIRENLVDFIQRNYPDSLPKARAVIDTKRHMQK